jgi:predicted  nucleic acid-binding Zn-ribbon protein
MTKTEDIYSKVIQNLSSVYKKESDFKDSDDFDICKLFDDCSEFGNDTKEYIRNAIFDYFSQKGFKCYVFFRSNNKASIRLKLFDLENNIYVDRLKKEYKDIEQHLKVKNEKDKIYILPKEPITVMLGSLESIEHESMKKDLIRSAVKKILDLHKRDAIFFVNNQLLIKKFTPAAENKDRAARRYYDDIPKEKLEKFSKFLKKSNIDLRIQNELKKLCRNDFDFKRINNFSFGKNFVKVLQDMSIRITGSLVSDEEEVIFGYANFLLRTYFEKIMLFLGTTLIDLVLEKDRNAEAFLKFYNGDVAFAPNGAKFKKPDIIDSYGQRWNFSTIFQLSMQRIKMLEKIKESQEAIQKTKDAIEDLGKKIAESEKEAKSKKEQMIDIDQSFQDSNEVTKQMKDDLQRKRIELKKLKDKDEKYKLQSEINKLSAEMKKILADEDRNMNTKKKLETEIERVDIKIKMLGKDLSAYEKKLQNDYDKKEQLIENVQPVEEKYHCMLQALSKALSSFRGI